MEKTTKLVIYMIIVVIIIIITVIMLLLINKTEKENDNPETVAFTDIEKLNNKNLFYVINDNINNYYNYIQKQQTEAINSISKDGEIIKRTNNGVFYSKEMYVLDKITNITVYVYGEVREKSQKENYYLIVNIDNLSNAFSILVASKEEFENVKNNIINVKYREDVRIQENQYNKIQEKSITDFEILNYYFEDYKYKALYEQEEAFKLIESRYKKEKFEDNINKYKEYIQNNLNNIIDANIVRHGVTKDGEFGEYICIDNNNSYYKFTETGINEYTVILDNYTLETDELLENYNKLTDIQKVTTNIDKVMKLINEKDYNTLYEYLNKNFKNNYFKTQEEFEQYIKRKFFDNNIVGKMNIEIQRKHIYCNSTI